MSINWRFWKRKTMEEKCDDFQSKLEKVPTMYANNFRQVGMFQHLGIGGVHIDRATGKPLGFDVPKMVYGWLDPSTGMDVNKAWILIAIKGHFIELRVTERVGEEMPKQPDTGGKAITFTELLSRIEHGDYDEMYNEDTDKTVTEELKEMIAKHKLKVSY